MALPVPARRPLGAAAPSLAPWARLLLVSAALGGPGLAAAQDDNTFDDLDEDDAPRPAAPTPKKGSADDEEADPDDDEWKAPEGSGTGEELNFDDEEEEGGGAQGPAEGQDTARVYREALEQYGELGPDEEALAWERYLQRYPASLFRTRIEARMEELNQSMYGEMVEDSVRTTDAGKAELRFAQPLLLESLDPRSKIRAGFEWGFPSWVNLMADLEYQIFRELSVHGGLRNRFTGTNAEVGAKYALVKSARLGLLVTGIFDARFNFDPAGPGLRPQVGVGKRFRFGDQHLDVQASGGSDLAIISADDGKALSPRLVGGANVSLAANRNLRVFFETSSYMKGFGDEELGVFRFNQLTFGMKYVQARSKSKDKLEAGFGASAPYTTNYWSYHYGAIMGDAIYYLDK
jgi:hypothetical protein